MSLKERVAYLSGLADGIAFNDSSNEKKLFTAVIDVLSAVAAEIDGLNVKMDAVETELESLTERLDSDDFWMDPDDDDDEDYGGFDPFDYDDDDDDDGEDGECDCASCRGGGEDDCHYHTDCPNCGVDIEITDDDLGKGSVTCTACNEEFELDFDDDEEDDEEENAD